MNYIVSTTTRIHRNFDGYEFMPKISNNKAMDIQNLVLEALDDYIVEDITLRDIPAFDIIKLKNRGVYSNDLVKNERVSKALFLKGGQSVLVNEFDHVVISSTKRGKKLYETFNDVCEVAKILEEKYPFSFDKRFGYLSSAPIFSGTSLIVTLKLHLPGINYYGYENLKNELRSIGFSFFPRIENNKKAQGSIFYLTNATGIGNPEEFYLERLDKILDRISGIEKNYRKKLYTDDIIDLEDMVYRSYGILQNARMISQKEAEDNLSNIELGLDLNLLSARYEDSILEFMDKIRASTIQLERGILLEKKTRRIIRASKIRKMIKERII